MPTCTHAVKPAARQLQYQSWECGLFLHFGIRTFYEGHRDWDAKPMPAEGFNPPPNSTATSGPASPVPAACATRCWSLSITTASSTGPPPTRSTA